MQELELANRYISTLDALLAGAPGAGLSRHLAAASLAGLGGADRGSPSATAAATAASAAAAAAASDPAAAGSLGGLYGSLGLASAALEAQIKRTLEGQAARVEAAEVGIFATGPSAVQQCGCRTHAHAAAPVRSARVQAAEIAYLVSARIYTGGGC